MAISHTLPTAPFEHPAMDYAFLRQEGIRLLEQLAGQVWTDFNIHDPGITILEQVCYAITELSYRINYSLPDLLTGAGEPTYGDMYTPAQILTSHPVTLIDLRKLVIDVEGIKNVWFEQVERQAIPLFYRTDDLTLRLASDTSSDQPVALRGLYRVLIEISELLYLDNTLQQQAVIREVTSRLHANRGLCEDFETIRILDPEKIQIQARIEIEAVDDATALLVEIYRRIAEHISQPVRFYSLSELLQAGKSIDQIFDGPRLDHGFIDTDELKQTRRRTELRTSDLIHVIMEVPGVRAVRTISLAAGRAPEHWSLSLDPDRTPMFDLPGSTLVLERNRLMVGMHVADAIASYYQSLRQAAARQSSTTDDIATLRQGRDRNLGAYYSLQHQFPATYGIGAGGLPESATPQRQAQARQLKAYLLFFDQLLANSFAQLANAKRLLSFADRPANTYLAQAIDDTQLGLDDIRRSALPTHQARLQQITENPYDPDGPVDSSRHNRLLDHLLARFAERFTDYSLILNRVLADGVSSNGQQSLTTDEKLIFDKQMFLQHYPQLSSARGTGFNELQQWGSANRSGLEQRVRYLLGLIEPDEQIYIVEHILLRPIANDLQQLVPILSDPYLDLKDPYSLQISCVFPSWPARFQHANFRSFAERTLREELPAHLSLSIHWFDQDYMAVFKSAYEDWMGKRRMNDDAPGVAPDAMGSVAIDVSDIPIRDARDRLIDLLGIGQTYPLRDPIVRDEQLTVVFNTSAKIPIEQSQRGVVYQLRYKREPVERTPDGDEGPGTLIEAEGNGGTLYLETYKIKDDIIFEILATKQPIHPHTKGNAAYLHKTATVKVGLDSALMARIASAPLLDPTIDTLTAPRVCNYGETVAVEVIASQEGVDYALIAIVAAKDGQGAQQIALSEGSVRGDLQTITIRSLPIFEDVDIRIRATKTFDQSEHRAPQTALLAAILPLKVRANPALAVKIEPSPIIDFKQPATIVIAATQASATYTLYARQIADRDFVRQTHLTSDVLTVQVPGEPAVRVQKPTNGVIWDAGAGFTIIGTAQTGSGGELRFTTDGLADDYVLIVGAEKAHQVAQDPQSPQSISSRVQLDQQVMVLTRPDPAPPLRLGVRVAGTTTTGELSIANGQPGVFYALRSDANSKDIGLPAYFHKRDDGDNQLNKGLDQLMIEVDFVVPRAWASSTAGDPTRVAPETPLLETGPLALDTSFVIRAMKAQTRVATILSNTFQIPSGPDVSPEKAVIDYGTKTRVRITASSARELYQVLQNGTPLGEPTKGTGQNRLLDTVEISEDTTFELLIQSDQPIALDRVLSVPVAVKPNPALPITATEASIDYNTSATVQIPTSQLGVAYQLMANAEPSGQPVAGTGNTITLSTGPLTATTTFSIRATKLASSDIFVDLTQRVTVEVRPAPTDGS